MTISQDNGTKGNNSQPDLVLERMTEHAESQYLTWSRVPEAVKNNVLDVAKFLYQERKDRLIITGEHNTGKTFTIEQFAYHATNVLRNAKMIPHDQEVAVFWADGRGFANGHENVFVQMLIDTVTLFEGESIIYTNNYYTAAIVEQTLPSVRIIMEFAPERFAEMQQSGISLSKNHQVCTGFSDDFDKSQTIKSLNAYHKRTMEDHYSVRIPRNFINSFVSFIYQNSEITKGDSNSEEPQRNNIPLGFWVDCLDEMLSEATFKPEKYQKENGELFTSKLIERTFNDNKEFFNPVNTGEDVVKAILEALGGDASDLDGGEGGGSSMMPPSLSGKTIVLSGGPLLEANGPHQHDHSSDDDSSGDIEFKDISTLSSRIKEKVVGQDKVVDEVSDSFWIPAAGLGEEDKPVRSMLFLGPTGVGKTKLSQTLAEELSEEPMNMIRLDMSEYSEKHDNHKLFGAPAGYVGFEEGGILTSQVQENPKSVILLDEVEKASPMIWDSFLQVLDAGRMTDSHGEVVDFSKTVVIMTSNLGANEKTHSTMGYTTMNSKPSHEKEQQLRRQNAIRQMEMYFKPEFLNRINSIFVFNRLPDEVLEDITNLEIKYLIDKVSLKSKSKSVLNTPDEGVIKKIVENSDAEKYGARDIKRTVEKSITKLVAESIVKQKNQRNTLNLGLDEDNNIVINTEKRKESSAKKSKSKTKKSANSDSSS